MVANKKKLIIFALAFEESDSHSENLGSLAQLV